MLVFMWRSGTKQRKRINDMKSHGLGVDDHLKKLLSIKNKENQNCHSSKL